MDGETPPQTLQVKQELLKHRAAISALQASYDLRATSGGMETPEFTPAPAFNADRAKPGGKVSFADMEAELTPAPAPREGHAGLRDLLLYTNPPLSLTVAVVGALLVAGVHYLLSGAHSVTLLTAVSYALLVDVAVNFVRSLVSRSWVDGNAWRGSSLARVLAERFAQGLDALADAHDRLLTARDPVLTLKAAAGLWMLATLGHYLSMWNVVTLVFLLAFTLPYALHKYQAPVGAAWGKASSTFNAKWAAMGLSRKQKALVLVVALTALWLRSCWATRLVAALLGALAVRCNLRPAEVEAIMQTAEPYTQSVKKRASRLSVAATDFANRTWGPPKAHFR